MRESTASRAVFQVGCRVTRPKGLMVCGAHYSAWFWEVTHAKGLTILAWLKQGKDPNFHRQCREKLRRNRSKKDRRKGE
jgi:hypothetical protein